MEDPSKLSKRISGDDDEDDNDLIGIALLFKGLYRLPCTINGIKNMYITKYIKLDIGNVEAALVSRVTTASASVDVRNARLGHISVDTVEEPL